MARATEIAKVLGKYGLDWLAHSDTPWRLFALPTQIKTKTDARSQPERLRLALEELGTTYIKLGQAISTRTDLVPPEYVAELAKLQDDAPPVPYEEIALVITTELGCPPHELFKWIDREPMAAASIGQVHRAELEDGTRVVVKVQRPNAEAQVERDLEVMKEAVRLVTTSKKLENFDLPGLLDEFAFTLRNELDYRREGRNSDRFRANFASDPTLRIPKVHWEYTTRRVLTMEEVTGIKITDDAGIDSSGLGRKLLASECARIVLTEIFEHGFFHADPHAGNFFVHPNGSISLIDFGMVGRIDRYERDSLMRMTLSLANQDVETLIDEILVVGTERMPVSRQELKMDLSRTLALHLEAAPEEFSLARMLQDTLAIAAKHNIRVPSDLLFLARAIAMCEGLGRTLDPEYRMMDTARAQLERIYRERRSPEALAEQTKQNYMEIGEMALDLPKRVRRLFGQLERGELTVTARLSDTAEIVKQVHRAFNRLSMSVLIAAVVVGLSVLALRMRPDQATWSAVVNTLLLLAIFGGFTVLFAMWRSRDV